MGIAFDLRPDLQALYKKLGSVKIRMSASGTKARAMRKQIQALLDSGQSKDMVAVSQLVTKIRSQLDALPQLNRRPEFARWPDTYTSQILNPKG